MGQFYSLLWDACGFWSLTNCGCGLQKKKKKPHPAWVFLRKMPDFICLALYTVLPALRANSCIAIDRLMIELLDFHIPFLSFTNAGFKGYGKNLLNRRLRITQLP